MACAVSAGVHAALVPDHLDHDRALGVAFVIATIALAAAAVLVSDPRRPRAGRGAAVLLGGLIVAYYVNVTTGLPWLAGESEPVDAIGVATKVVEAIGLVFALQLGPIPSERRSLTKKEARS